MTTATALSMARPTLSPMSISEPGAAKSGTSSTIGTTHRS